MLDQLPYLLDQIYHKLLLKLYIFHLLTYHNFATQIILATLPLYSQNATWRSSTANTDLKKYLDIRNSYLLDTGKLSTYFKFKFTFNYESYLNMNNFNN